MYYPDNMTYADIEAYELDMAAAHIWEELTEADLELMALAHDSVQELIELH